MAIYRMLVVPLLLLGSFFLSPFNRKVRQTLGLRLQKTQWPEWLGQAPTLWVHCSSGEFEYARPVIREWRELKPQGKVFVTYFSPSFKRFIEQAHEVDASAPLPLDLTGPMASFVNKLKPEVLAVSRTDLWPEMCAQARHNRIPIVLFSATCRPGFWRELWRFFTRWQLNQANLVLAVSDQDATGFSKLKLESQVEAMGDSRYDQVIFRLKNPRPVKTELKPSGKFPILVAGSTWPSDEAVICKATSELLKKGDLRLILAPHEVHKNHIQELVRMLNHLDLQAQLYSEAQEWTKSILIVDQVGVLAELYRWGQLAFVGGSFKSSVHSVMEPLAAGCLTFVGPYHKNNREAVDFSLIPIEADLKMVNVVKDSRQFTLKLNEALSQMAKLNWSDNITHEVQCRTGSSRAIAKRLIDISAGRPLPASDQMGTP